MTHPSHRPLPGTVTTEDFFSEVEYQITQAFQIVQAHQSDGEDDFLSAAQSYPHGAQDLLFLIFMKSRRALGYDSALDLDKVFEELQDILNYAGFCLAYLSLATQGAIHGRLSSNTPDPSSQPRSKETPTPHSGPSLPGPEV